MATLDEVQSQISALSLQMSRLATVTQITNLRAALDTYKNDTDTRLNTLTGRMDSYAASLNDILARLDALE